MITLKIADWGPPPIQIYSVFICLISSGILAGKPVSLLFENFHSLISFASKFFILYLVNGNVNPSEIEKHLELGKEMMARGQLQDALTHFHAALEGDPTNYLTLYRRATVYLAQGRARAALEDLNRVLEIQPEFIQARAQKGNILMKLGRLDEAHIELEKVVSQNILNGYHHTLKVLYFE